jgi:hypothetical protein
MFSTVIVTARKTHSSTGSWNAAIIYHYVASYLKQAGIDSETQAKLEFFPWDQL